MLGAPGRTCINAIHSQRKGITMIRIYFFLTLGISILNFSGSNATELGNQYKSESQQDGEVLRMQSWKNTVEWYSPELNSLAAIGIALMALMLLSLIIFNILRSGKRPTVSTRILFHPISYQIQSDKAQVHKAYLRSLSDSKALLLCDEELPRGTPLKLDLGSPSNLPYKDLPTSAVVRHSRKLPNNHFNVWVQFAKDPSVMAFPAPYTRGFTENTK